MSGWIKFEKDLLTDPRVLRIAKALDRRWITYDTQSKHYSDPSDSSNAATLPAVTLVCGALVRIWSLADTHIDPDNVLPLGISELDEVVGIPGFCELLPSDWLVPVDDHSVELPEYHAHNGTEAKKRALTQKRVSRHRAKALRSGNGQSLPDQDQDQDQDQHKAQAKKQSGVRAFSPPPWIPSDAWAGFEEHRKKIRKPMTDKARALIVRELEKLKPDDPVEVIEQSIRNGWQDVFALRQKSGVAKETALRADL